MTPQQAREKLTEYLEEQDKLTAAIGRTGIRFAVTNKFIVQIKRYYGELMSPLLVIAMQDRDEQGNTPATGRGE